MISCKDITENANGYIDHELPFMARMKMKIHLMMCVNCRRYISQLRTTIAALGKMGKQQPVDEDTVDKIVDKLKNYKPENSDNQ